MSAVTTFTIFLQSIQWVTKTLLTLTICRYPFACVAVDLVGKKEVVFRSGYFVDAIRASMAIPGFFAPVRMDGMVLVDGGMLNNYPVDVAKEMGADIIIGVKQTLVITHLLK